MTERVAIVTWRDPRDRRRDPANCWPPTARTWPRCTPAGRHDAARGTSRSRLTAAGGSVSVHPGDVGDPDFCQALVAELVADRGRVDYLVNNAGLLIESTAVACPEDDPGGERGKRRRCG